MTAKTDYFENLLLDAYVRQDAASKAILAACNLQACLFYDVLSDTTSDVSALNEVGYVGRVSYATLSAAYPASALGTMSNSLGVLSWTMASGATGNINSFAIVDSTVTPDRVWWYLNVTGFQPGASTVIQYALGQLTFVEA